MLFRTFAAAGLLLSAVGGAVAAPMPMMDAPDAALPSSPLIQAFVQDAGTSNQFEMTEAQIALEKSEDPAVRTFAQRMLNDHHMAEMMLERAAAPTGVYTHFMFDKAHQAKIDALQDLSGDAFDQAYWADQREAHAAAIGSLSDYAASGEDPALRAWARETLPVVRDHARMLAAMTGQGPLAMQ